MTCTTKSLHHQPSVAAIARQTETDGLIQTDISTEKERKTDTERDTKRQRKKEMARQRE